MTARFRGRPAICQTVPGDRLVGEEALEGWPVGSEPPTRLPLSGRAAEVGWGGTSKEGSRCVRRALREVLHMEKVLHQVPGYLGLIPLLPLNSMFVYIYIYISLF